MRGTSFGRKCQRGIYVEPNKKRHLPITQTRLNEFIAKIFMDFGGPEKKKKVLEGAGGRWSVVKATDIDEVGHWTQYKFEDIGL